MLNLQDLNDDCIYILFKNLNVSSQYNLACVCKRFQEIFKSFAKIPYHSINLKTLNAVRRNNETHFLKLIGSNVKIWDGAFSVQRMENISKYCKNLEAIKLDFCNNWPIKYFEYLLRMKSLKTIYLIYSRNCKENSIGRLFSVLQYLPNLQHLSLNACTLQHVGINISNLCGLRTLDLNFGQSMNPDYFITCCMSLRNLNRLELKRFTACHFTSDTFQAMVDHCKNLEMLYMTIHEIKVEYEKVAKLPKLKYFILNCLHLRSEMIDALVEYKANDLILLKIPLLKIEAEAAADIGKLIALRELQCWPENYECFKHLCNLKNLEILNLQFTRITDDILLMLLTALTKLRLVDLYNCTYITANIVSPILKLLKERAQFDRGVFRYPLELCVRETKISLDTLEDPELLEAKHLLRLNLQRKTNYSLKFKRIFDYRYCY